MPTTSNRSPLEPPSPHIRSSRAGRILRAVFWSDELARARTLWLILIPVVGAFGTMILVEDALDDSGLSLSVRHALWSVAASIAAMALIILSRRYLGARSLADYGLTFDRRSLRDLRAGLVIGVAAVTIPFAIGAAVGWVEVAELLVSGEHALLSGIAISAVGMIWVGLWEELTMRGVFLCNAADGFGRWLSPRRAVASAIGLSGVVFGVAHLSHTGLSPLLLTWVLAGVVFGVVYVLAGNLALPIGIHITFNLTYNAVFVRTDIEGAEHFSTLTRVDIDPTLTFLQYGGLIEATAFASALLLALAWVRHSRGRLAMSLPARKPAASAELRGRSPGHREPNTQTASPGLADVAFADGDGLFARRRDRPISADNHDREFS